MSLTFSATTFVAAVRAGEFAFYGTVLYAFFGKRVFQLVARQKRSPSAYSML